MLAGPLSFRLRAAVFPERDVKLHPLSMPQWARTVATNVSGVGIHDRAKYRVWQHLAVSFATGFDPAKGCYLGTVRRSAQPAAGV